MYAKPFVGTAPDYAQKKNWLVLPEKTEYPVDVVYLYPSSCLNPEAETICAIDDPYMAAMAKNVFGQQATAFDTVANIYAPLWRQVSALKLPMMTFDQVDQAEWAEPRTDVYAALDYYFEHLNGGRPFFLAGHSQGSKLCFMVLSEYMQAHPEYYKNMIAAYCIGYAMTPEYMKENPHVKPARGAEDLGVVVSWNTEGPANKGRDSLVIIPHSAAINPLNWKTDATPAGAELSLGSYAPHLMDPGMDKLPVNADATLDTERGSVIVSNPALAMCAVTAAPGMDIMEPVFGPASYHGCDYTFFYYNIRENARLRAQKWAEKR